MFATKYLGQREAELISVSTATGDITVDRRLVPSHYLYDLNAGYRRKIGRYNTSSSSTSRTSPTTTNSTAPSGRPAAPTASARTLNF
jgi:hypothetical protein